MPPWHGRPRECVAFLHFLLLLPVAHQVGGNRIALTDNSIIEASLGKFGITCMEDLVHEIFTVGPAFKQASNFLWPFKLRPACESLKMMYRMNFSMRSFTWVGGPAWDMRDARMHAQTDDAWRRCCANSCSSIVSSLQFPLSTF